MTAACALAPPRLAALLAVPPPPLRRQRPAVGEPVWVELRDDRRKAPPEPATASGLKGLRFERAVGRALALYTPSWPEFEDLRSGQWLRFASVSTGVDWAQPDHYVVLRDRVLLLECKLSQTLDAWHQLEVIYRPLLEWLYERPVLTVAAFRFLTTTPEGPLRALRELTEGSASALADKRFTLHVYDPRRLA